MTTPATTLDRVPARNTICIWYDGDAEEAARFYASVFPDSSVKAVHRAPGDYPAGKQGGVLTVEFTVLGIPCVGTDPDRAAAKRAFEAMMQMGKIDIATIEAARRG